MATLMEKDVLLEYISFGYLINTNTNEAKADLKTINDLWANIIDTEPQNLDFDTMVQQIDAIRMKYESIVNQNGNVSIA